MCLASCSEENSATLKVEAELGALADYIKLTDQEVVVSMSDEKDDGVDCKVLTSSLALEVTKSVASDYSFTLEVAVLDKNHVVIGRLPSFHIEGHYDNDNGDLRNILNAGSVRAQMRNSKKAADFTPGNQEQWNKILKEGVYIQIKPCSHPQNMQNMRLNLQKQKIQNLPMAQPPKMKIKPTVLQPLLKIGMQC